MKNLILLGAPGSGKGTQSAKLVESLGYEHVSTGNLLREEIEKKSELGIRVKTAMESGQLVSDELVVELLKSNLDLRHANYIFDGYPRNIEQAKTLSEILGSNSYIVVFFSLDTDILVERLGNRRVTKDGKNIYNMVTNPPKVAGVCDLTGEALIQRDDDKEEVVRKRMKIFEETISPVLSYYKDLGLLVEVDANNSLSAVYEAVTSKIN